MKAKSFALVILFGILAIITLPFSFRSTSAAAETIDTKLRNELLVSYAKTKQLSGMSSFNGYCGICTGYQLWAVGLYNSYIGFNGNSAYNTLMDRVPLNDVERTFFRVNIKAVHSL